MRIAAAPILVPPPRRSGGGAGSARGVGMCGSPLIRRLSLALKRKLIQKGKGVRGRERAP